MDIKVTVQGTEKLVSQIGAIATNAQERHALSFMAGKRVISAARRRIKRQKNLDGSPFAPRKDKRNKRNLLESIYERIVIRANLDGVAVTFNGKWAHFAYQQQTGTGERWTAEKAAKAYQITAEGMATRAQAKALVRLGFREGGKKHGWRKVTVLQIERRLTMAQAGLIIRALESGGVRKISWSDAPPKRVALGLTDKEADKIMVQVAKQALKKIERGKL